ncbi:hypothetical protein C7H19_15775 [Aphanothece hegewaldii CCALA 016]|uniref:Uncharacterized protein n=1 Tax=Aphanothece hegewaldii CCALA 016 TaxID=2107694 RepID=A0A2T1LVE9_9CHRO|nr:hypothetical protein [Aphanothece hegewaldii]PSF35695.1 hypothetical protein C7H19_15775 [Aphanothece hegewaldii CCALA 016]
MNQLPNKTAIKNPNPLETTPKKWWNLPVWGKGSILEYLFAGGKASVSETAIMLHNREMMDALFFAKTAESIDSEKFNSKEFILFLKIKYCLARGIEEYEGLADSVKLLQAAIEAKNSYITLDQTELRFRSSKQQEFYQFVEKLLDNYEDQDLFRTQIQEKLNEVLPSIKTEEGKIALQAYVKELNKLSEYELGLKLLALFKSYQLADYSILKTISDMVSTLREKDTIDFKGLIALVMSKYEVFQKLKKIIGVSDKQNNPDTYARMVQYIALSYRHKLSYAKFAELLQVIRQWIKPYFAIIAIRQDNPPEQYIQPKSFKQEIPGEKTYEKYKISLTDQKTGRIYIDLGEENN